MTLRLTKLSRLLLSALCFVACTNNEHAKPGDRDGDNAAGDGDTAGSGGADSVGDGDGDTAGDGGGDSPDDGDGDGGAPVDALLPPSLSPVLSYCPFDDTEDLTTFEGRAVVRVCHPGDARSGCDVDSLTAALTQAGNGTRIEVVGDGADYLECGVIPAEITGLEIVGVCGRPHFKSNVCQKKGVFLNLGKDTSLSHLEVSGAEISAEDGGNAAAVRDQGLGGLKLSYVYFHDNQNGILGGAGEMQIDWSRFEANGSAVDPGYTHNTYFSADVDNVVIRNSLFLRAGHEGNNMKSRAQRMEFYCSVSASLDGVDSRELDVSEGGELVITNSLIQQGAESVNSGMLGFATEAGNAELRHDEQKIHIEETDFINDKDRGTFLAYNAFGGFSLTLSDVRFVGPGTPVQNINLGEETVVQTQVAEFTNRAEAGLPPASSDHFELPAPRGCVNFEYF